MKLREEIVAYWIDEIGPKGWYASSAELDDQIRDKYHGHWTEARDGGFGMWLCSPVGALAYLILTDQFPRNMFRDQGAAFSTDEIARSAAKAAIDRNWDLEVSDLERQFFYLPLMHSENISDQDRCVRLFVDRAPDNESNLHHARAHRDVIRSFGRFPYRNDALGRTTTDAEAEWMAAGGYRLALENVDAAKAP